MGYHFMRMCIIYLPFINAKSTRQLADNLPYHQRVFTYLWDMVNPIRWWQLIVSVSDELLFCQKQFPNMVKDGVMRSFREQRTA